MEWSKQFEIIKEKATPILRREGKGYSLQTMSELLGVGRGKVQAWERGQRPSADDLAAISRVLGFRPEWLLLGQGNPLEGGKAKSAARSATNAKKQIIGDLLNDILALLQVDVDTFAQKLKTTPDAALDILYSRREPTWDELLRIHQQFHVDIHFLLTGEGENFTPYDLFTRLCSSTGIKSYDCSALASACLCEKEDMRAWVRQWKQGKDPLFPPDWLSGLVENYSINPAWLYQGKGPSHLSKDDVQRQTGRNTGYTCAEPPAGVSKATEDPAAYPDPRKAVGDDSV